MNVLQLHSKPRTLANVLLDLREARDDYECAITDLGESRSGTLAERDADDRASEADSRLDALREEFESGFLAATGLTFKQVQEAVKEAVL